MAEIAQRKLIGMAVEFEEMTRTKLFSLEECRTVKRKRKEFESKINGLTKLLKDFNEYIAYELCLYRLIKVRRNQLQNGERKDNLDKRILRRIRNLYEVSMQRFPQNEDVYFNYFKFCRETNYINASNGIIDAMLKNHKNNEEAWLIAARWHVHDKKDMVEAIKLLKKGIAIHKESKSLYSECIYYEVKCLQSLVKDENKGDKYKLLNLKLGKYIEEMISNIKDYQHYIDILKYLETYEYTLPAQDSIISHLEEQHNRNEEVWDYLAKRKLKVHHYISDDKIGGIRSCIEKYEQGLAVLKDEKKQTLLNMYLKCLVDIKNEEYLNQNMERKHILIKAFEDASTTGSLLEECYISWLELADDNEARSILRVGTTKCSHSVDLWKLRLRCEIIRGITEDIIATFKIGNEVLEENACQLWILMLRYHILNSTKEELEQFYISATQHQHANVANFFKPKYLEWVALNFGLDKVREVYIPLANMKPFCKELYLRMINLESFPFNKELDIWEQVHLLACEQFGKEDIDVFLKYFDFCFFNKDGKIANDIKYIYETAKSMLNYDLFLEFEDKFNERKMLRNLS